MPTKKKTTKASIRTKVKATGYRLPHGYAIVKIKKRKPAKKKTTTKRKKRK